jgi:crossover junction endodeoxyribonuclease RuvC
MAPSPATLVLGIDPGIATTGVALVRSAGGKRTLSQFGVITTPAGMAGPKRLAMLHGQLLELVAEIKPQAAAVEQLFFASNRAALFSSRWS